MSRWRIFLVVCILTLIQLPCDAAEEVSFFDKDDVVCPGMELTRGGCTVDRSDQLSCRFTYPPEKTSGAELMYIVWHFTSKEDAQEKFRLKVDEYEDVHEDLKKGINGVRIDIHEFRSESNIIVVEHEQEWIGSGKPSYVLRHATRTGDSVVTQVNLIAYDSEQGFEADKVNVPACINDAIERKIPGITRQGPSAAGSTPASAEEPAGGGPAEATGSNPVSDAIGSAESVIQGGLTPLGQELMNNMNNLIGDLTGDKPVPPEVEEAIKKAGADCADKEPKTRDKCFHDAAVASGDPLICIKMRTSFFTIRDCYLDVAKESMNPQICEQFLLVSGASFDQWRERCYSLLYSRAAGPEFCDNLGEPRKDECIASMAQCRNDLNLCYTIGDPGIRNRCALCYVLESGDENLCETLDLENSIRYCHEAVRRKESCYQQGLGDLLFGAKEKTTACGSSG